MENYTKEQLWKAVTSFEAFFGRRYIEDAPKFCRNCAKVSHTVEYCEDQQESRCEDCSNAKCWECKKCNDLYCDDCGEPANGVCEKCHEA